MEYVPHFWYQTRIVLVSSIPFGAQASGINAKMAANIGMERNAREPPDGSEWGLPHEVLSLIEPPQSARE
jgi:hypothetical protein